MTKFFPVREWGIQTLSAVEPGLPQFVDSGYPHASDERGSNYQPVGGSGHYGRNAYWQKIISHRRMDIRMNDNQEIFAFSMGNFLAAALQAAVLLMALFQELQWENSIRVRHS